MGGSSSSCCSDEQRFRFKFFVVSLYESGSGGKSGVTLNEDAMSKLKSYTSHNPERIPRICRKINKVTRSHLTKASSSSSSADSPHMQFVLISVEVYHALMLEADAVDAYVPHVLELCAMLFDEKQPAYNTGAAELLTVMCMKLVENPSPNSQRLILDFSERAVPVLQDMLHSPVKERVAKSGGGQRSMMHTSSGSMGGLSKQVKWMNEMQFREKAPQVSAGCIAIGNLAACVPEVVETLMDTQVLEHVVSNFLYAVTHGGGNQKMVMEASSQSTPPSTVKWEPESTSDEAAMAVLCTSSLHALKAITRGVAAARLDDLIRGVIHSVEKAGMGETWASHTAIDLLFYAVASSLEAQSQKLGMSLCTIIGYVVLLGKEQLSRLFIQDPAASLYSPNSPESSARGDMPLPMTVSALGVGSTFLASSSLPYTDVLSSITQAAAVSPVVLAEDVPNAFKSPAALAGLLRALHQCVIVVPMQGSRPYVILAVIQQLFRESTAEVAVAAGTRSFNDVVLALIASLLSSILAQQNFPAMDVALHFLVDACASELTSVEYRMSSSTSRRVQQRKQDFLFHVLTMAAAYMRALPDSQRWDMDIFGSILDRLCERAKPHFFSLAAQVLCQLLAGEPEGYRASTEKTVLPIFPTGSPVDLHTSLRDVEHTEEWVLWTVAKVDKDTRLSPRHIVEFSNILAAFMAGGGVQVLPFILRLAWTTHTEYDTGKKATSPVWQQLALSVLADVGRVYELPTLQTYVRSVWDSRAKHHELSPCFSPELRVSEGWVEGGLAPPLEDPNGSYDQLLKQVLAAASHSDPSTSSALPLSFTQIAQCVAEEQRDDIRLVFSVENVEVEPVAAAIVKECFSEQAAAQHKEDCIAAVATLEQALKMNNGGSSSSPAKMVSPTEVVAPVCHTQLSANLYLSLLGDDCHRYQTSPTTSPGPAGADGVAPSAGAALQFNFQDGDHDVIRKRTSISHDSCDGIQASANSIGKLKQYVALYKVSASMQVRDLGITPSEEELVPEGANQLVGASSGSWSLPSKWADDSVAGKTAVAAASQLNTEGKESVAASESRVASWNAQLPIWKQFSIAS